MATLLNSFPDNMNVAIIGASGGIGGAFVSLLAEDDRVAHIDALARSDVSFPYNYVTQHSIDITDEDSITRAASSCKQELHLIIVATGILHSDNGLKPEKSLRDLSFNFLQQNYAINTIGPMLVAKHFTRLLPREGKSGFAALSARVGSISDNHIGGWYGYRASKTALNMMLKNTAIELGRRYKNTVILGLHPGTVDTGLSKPFQSHVSHDIFTPEHSAKCLLHVINERNANDSGKCFDWENIEIPE